MKRRRGTGEEKKKEEEKGGERKKEGKSLFFTGVLYTFYVHSTSLKISTPAGTHSRFFLASLDKTDLGVEGIQRG